MDYDYCSVCGEELGGSSHYHCPKCGEECSMMGHKDEECDPVKVVKWEQRKKFLEEEEEEDDDG
jgi:anaerobic ribonucleoside-triphosphate reductase